MAETTASPTDALYAAIGRRIQVARIQAHRTQDEIARRVGLTRTSITNIEHGRQKLLLHTLYAIAEALDLEPSALLPEVSAVAPTARAISLGDSVEPAVLELITRVVGQRRGEEPQHASETSEDRKHRESAAPKGRSNRRTRSR